MTDVFISYSRRDLDFVKKLDAALTAKGKVVWFDQKTEPLVGILPGERWWEQIKDGIETADNFLFVISLASMASPYCNAEVAYALAHEKRIVTVLYHGEQSETETLSSIGEAIDTIPPDTELPSSVSATIANLRSLTRRNWLEISQIQYVPFSVDGAVASPLNLLIRALDTDLAWVKTWSQVRQAAQIWVETGDDSYLWSEMRMKPIREEIEKRGLALSNIEHEFLCPEVERLEKQLKDPALDHANRARIGERLHIIGDTRPGVGLRSDGLPDLVWCKVPSGQVTISQYVFSVESFFITKYLITHEQFQSFIDSGDGFIQEEWWQGITKFGGKLGEQHFQFNNHPRDSVNWFDAVAFCRWLTHRMGFEVRLPTEWEWQLASTKKDNKGVYPWGSDWKPEFVNTYESGLSRTTAVGMYPQGVSHVGALDMCGNVFEWCLNQYNFLVPTIDSIDPILGLVRGGSWNSINYLASCTRRIQGNLNHRGYDVGFRVVKPLGQ